LGDGENKIEMNELHNKSLKLLNGFTEEYITRNDNDLGFKESKVIFDFPLIGCSKASDPLFIELKKYVGDFHWTPEEIFKYMYPEYDINKSNISVLSFAFPVSEYIRQSNKNENIFPSEEWTRGRIYGESFIEIFENKLCNFLNGKGYKSVAPMRTEFWRKVNSDKFGYASTWSHRHIAYVCGLGTFGLCDGLITEKGKAVRLGSIITELDIPETTRKYSSHNENCLYYTSGKCSSCIKRCPANAISEMGHDKKKCNDYITYSVTEHNQKEYKLERGGCALCQVKVPCESLNPTNNKD